MNESPRQSRQQQQHVTAQLRAHNCHLQVVSHGWNYSIYCKYIFGNVQLLMFVVVKIFGQILTKIRLCELASFKRLRQNCFLLSSISITSSQLTNSLLRNFKRFSNGVPLESKFRRSGVIVRSIVGIL